MNKNTLNAQRLLQYFRKDWSENAAQLYYYFTKVSHPNK